jgi:hypothetical protein
MNINATLFGNDKNCDTIMQFSLFNVSFPFHLDIRLQNYVNEMQYLFDEELGICLMY